MSATNIEFNLALNYYYLQLLNCLLCHAATDLCGLQIFIRRLSEKSYRVAVIYRMHLNTEKF